MALVCLVGSFSSTNKIFTQRNKYVQKEDSANAYVKPRGLRPHLLNLPAEAHMLLVHPTKLMVIGKESGILLIH